MQSVLRIFQCFNGATPVAQCLILRRSQRPVNALDFFRLLEDVFEKKFNTLDFAVFSGDRDKIMSQKQPSPAVAPLYQKAPIILERFFPLGDLDMIHQEIEKLRTKSPKSEWESNDNSNTALALESFMKFYAQLDLSACSIQRFNQQAQSKLGIGGVDVSVRPDFYLRFEKRKQPFIGALKFHWTKNDDYQLSQEGGVYVATTLHHFLEDFHASTLKPSLEHCFSIDVFRQAIRTAPKGYKRTRSNIVAGCEEIALRWNAA